MSHGRRSTYIRGCRCDICRAAQAAYQRLYMSRNPERAARERASAYKRHKAKIRARQAAYGQTLSGKIVQYQKTLRRRARQKNQFIEDVDPKVVYEMHGGRCGICGEFIQIDPSISLGQQMHVDHVIPLAPPHCGLHCYANVQPAHPLCNLRKGDRI